MTWITKRPDILGEVTLHEVDLRWVVLRWWRYPGRPFLSTRYCLLNGGAFGWAFMLMRKHRPTPEAP
jgi:hypothetical protein